MPEHDGGSRFIEILLYRWINGTVPNIIAELSIYNRSYSDADVEKGKEYFYKVVVVNKAGSSPDSRIVSASMLEEDEKDEGFFSYIIANPLILIITLILIILLIIIKASFFSRSDKIEILPTLIEYEE